MIKDMCGYVKDMRRNRQYATCITCHWGENKYKQAQVIQIRHQASEHCDCQTQLLYIMPHMHAQELPRVWCSCIPAIHIDHGTFCMFVENWYAFYVHTSPHAYEAHTCIHLHTHIHAFIRPLTHTHTHQQINLSINYSILRMYTLQIQLLYVTPHDTSEYRETRGTYCTY